MGNVNNYSRKCSICDIGTANKSINIKDDDFIRDSSGKFYHIECFKNKESNKKRGKLSSEELNEKIEQMKLETDKWKNEAKYKNDFYEWIYDNYNIYVIPNWVTIKISNINNGTYKGLREGISYEDMLIIFKKMKNYLDKVAYEKTSKGKGFKNQSDRLSYDLAIVINNYDKYKNWKANQVKNQVENKTIEKHIEEKKMYNNLISKQTDDEGINVAELIDEFF